MSIDPEDIIGNSTVRELCGQISRNTLLTWRRDPELGFPAPFLTVERTELWDRRAVLAWRKANWPRVRTAKKWGRARKGKT